MKAEDKAKQFLKTSLRYYDKEIAIPSNRVFSITELLNERDAHNHKTAFIIQYGFPQSGAVCLSFILDTSSEKPHATITDFSIYTQPADKNLVVANFSTKNQNSILDELNIDNSFGLDTKTVKFSSYEEIDNNPNALHMIDMAIDDLNNALVLGDCRECSSIGSDRIPYCNTVPYPEKEEENNHKK
ncbi:MAG: hypothetical protein IKF47_01125 [Bacilli bacterium]|nr:hypothetical protein [Bacilli bacterium]